MNGFSELKETCRRLVEQAAFFTARDLVIGGSRIRICCVDFTPSPLMFSSVSHLFAGGETRGSGSPYDFFSGEKPCETFYCVQRESAHMNAALPQELCGREGRFVYSGEEGRYALSAEHGFFSLYEKERGATYIWMCPDKHSLDSFVSHPFHMEFSWWALRNGWLFLHSAAVGVSYGAGKSGDAGGPAGEAMSGTGILISGAGGSGKSTLAMTSMLYGMSLLSDDYLLIRSDPVPTAERIYSSAYLKRDMLERLPEFKKAVYWTCRERDKSLIALDACGGTVVNTLSLSAVIFPHIAHAEVPKILPNPDIRTRIPLIASTSYQNRELKNPGVFRQIMRLLRAVPAYDFQLTDDLRLNAEFLKDWVRAGR